MTIAQVDDQADAVDEFDVQGILAFAERILPRASDLWVRAPLDYKQRLQQLFFPDGNADDGNRFNRTAVTAPLLKYLAPGEGGEEIATGATLEASRRDLADVVEEWLLVRVARGLDVPALGGATVKVRKAS